MNIHKVPIGSAKDLKAWSAAVIAMEKILSIAEQDTEIMTRDVIYFSNSASLVQRSKSLESQGNLLESTEWDLQRELVWSTER